MIIDAHAHLGYDEVFDEDFTAGELLESRRRCGIDLTLVQPALVHDLDTVEQYHNAIADLCRLHPGKFRGIANPNPHLPQQQYETEVRRCIEHLGFVGIKLHPFAHAVNPQSRHGRRVFEIAASMHVPVIVHTGPGIPWSCPSLLEPLAREYAGVRIVAAHAGGMFSAEAEELARNHDNVFLELSWQSGFIVRQWVERLGPHRLMFGSDHADNAAVELARINSLGLKAQDIETICGGTAQRVFDLKDA